MKKILKAGGYVLIVLVVLAVIGSMISKTETTEKETKTGETVTKTAKSEPKEEKTDKKPGKTEFEQIKSGMTLEEVEKILGPGEMLAESESGDVKIQQYSWDAEGDFGANISVSFMNELSDVKSQFGLK